MDRLVCSLLRKPVRPEGDGDSEDYCSSCCHYHLLEEPWTVSLCFDFPVSQSKELNHTAPGSLQLSAFLEYWKTCCQVAQEKWFLNVVHGCLFHITCVISQTRLLHKNSRPGEIAQKLSAYSKHLCEKLGVVPYMPVTQALRGEETGLLGFTGCHPHWNHELQVQKEILLSEVTWCLPLTSLPMYVHMYVHTHTHPHFCLVPTFTASLNSEDKE